MIIISGKYKGRIIQMPKGIRPTQNKVRKALFDILGDIEGLSFLELYAGSGAVGFEAISRGVTDLVLVEYNRDCLLAINKNIEALKTKACSLYPKEVKGAIESLCKEKKKFDIIFLDPPYYQGKPSLGSRQNRPEPMANSISESLTKKTLQMLGACDILAPNGLVIAQHFKKDPLSDRAGDLVMFRQAKYADTILSFYRKVTLRNLQKP